MSKRAAFDPVVNEPYADRDYEQGVLHGLRLALRICREQQPTFNRQYACVLDEPIDRIRAAIKRRKEASRER